MWQVIQSAIGFLLFCVAAFAFLLMSDYELEKYEEEFPEEDSDE